MRANIFVRLHFAQWLVDLWLSQPTLAAKAALLAVWSDPLLSDAVRDWLVLAADRVEHPDQAADLRWHARLAERCHDQGLAIGLAAHQEADGDTPGESAADESAQIDPAALLVELAALAQEDRPEGWPRILPRFRCSVNAFTGGSEHIEGTASLF